jgi:hypothetical protein
MLMDIFHSTALKLFLMLELEVHIAEISDFLVEKCKNDEAYNHGCKI